MNGNEVFYSIMGISEPPWAQKAADFALSVLDFLEKAQLAGLFDIL